MPVNNPFVGDAAETMIRESGKLIFLNNLTKFIFSVVIRLSFVASVWLFLFDHSQWVGMLVFFILILATTPIPARSKKETK
jgi:hypothetical protein